MIDYRATFTGIRRALQDRAANLERAGQSFIQLGEVIELSEVFERDALDSEPEALLRIAHHLRALSETRNFPVKTRTQLTSLADVCQFRATGTIDGAPIPKQQAHTAGAQA